MKNELYDLNACARLSLAIIEQAVRDYRVFCKRGVVLNGRVSPFISDAIRIHGLRGVELKRHVEDTLYFFRDEGMITILLDSGDFTFSASSIRRHLGIPSL